MQARPVADVDAFWKASPFDLRLRKWEGNCDLCFLKGKAKRMRIMRDKPETASWWIEQEQEQRVPRTKRAKAMSDTFAKSAAASPMLPMDFGEMTPRTQVEPTTRAHPFRIDAPRYSVLLELAGQPMLLDDADLDGEAIDDIGDCFCNAA